MSFKRACGHEFHAKPGEKYAWLRAAQEPCMRCHLEAKAEEKEAAMEAARVPVKFVVQVYSNGTWRKVRGGEGGPWSVRGRAERIAQARERAERRPSSTEGLPHRVVEVAD